MSIDPSTFDYTPPSISDEDIFCKYTPPPGDFELYHGTSARRFKLISSENRLRIAPCGVTVVSMSTKREVAEYFAENAVDGDEMDHFDRSAPTILVLSGRKLLELNYDLRAFSDPIRGDGECDWESEVCCVSDITPLREVLLRIAHMTDSSPSEAAA
jgi:hypothetical protein